MAFGSGPPLPDWRAVRDQKKAEQEKCLARFSQWRLKRQPPATQADVSEIPLSELSSRELEILAHDATALVDHIRNGQYTAVEITEAYCHAAIIAHELTNCLSEIFLEEGLERAAQLDAHFARTGELVGPLHGVPCSIKNHIRIRGQDTAAGYIGWVGKTVSDYDAVVVDILRHAGAVLYCKTANPQTMMSLETESNILGRTLNPFNRNLTPGGSSGGESALLALRGSVIGVGTDIGGSIRVPAAHGGLYGLKPSNHRLPHAGLHGSHDGMEAILGSLGPLAHSARDLSLFCQVMSDHEPWLVEPQLVELPWKQSVVDGIGMPKRLTFGILKDDGIVAPHPPVLEALRRVECALVSAGHEVVDWDPVDQDYSWKLITQLYFPDAANEYREAMLHGGEPQTKQTEWILSHAPKALTLAETWKLNGQREAFRTRLATRWNETKYSTKSGRVVDIVLCPAAPTLAPPHDTTRYWGYTSFWNLADYPGVVFPLGRFHAADAARLCSETRPDPRNDIERFIHGQWDPQTYDNAPISLQLVGRRFNEEKVLYALNILESALKQETPDGI